MKKTTRAEKLITMAAIMTVLLLPGGVQAAEPAYTTSLGFEFASGEYGTGIRTDAIFVPFTVSVKPTERLDLSLELPYVYQSSSAVVAGQFRAMQQSSMGTGTSAMAAAMGGSGSGMGSGPRTTASGATVDNAQNGLGDLTVKAGYVVVPEGEYLPAIRPNLAVKIPTADKNKFLGTGAFDEAIGVEFSKWFGDWLADAETGYTFQGNSSVVAVKDYFYYTLGGGYQLTERLRPSIIFKGSTPRVEGASAQLETRLQLKYQMTDHTGLDGYLAKGLTTASPDYGTGLAVYVEF
ncbi:MAG TPA: transporter [Geobacteraceae bacterium]